MRIDDTRADDQPHSTAPGARWGLFALAVGAFGIGSTEFSPMGLLPIIARDIHVSIPTAGLLVSGYAIGVMVGAPIMTLALGTLPRRLALMLLMAIFTFGNIISALAPGYWSLLLARIVTSFNHGAFFGLGSVVAATLVTKERRAGAVATMFMGLTIANIGGVPAATWIGQRVGWRAAFAGIGVLGVLAILALAWAMPKGRPGQPANIRREIRVLTEPNVLLALATTVAGAGAMFTLYTFVAPVLQSLTQASGDLVTVALVTIGVGFTIGNWLGGRLARQSLDGAAATFLLAQATVSFALPFLLNHALGALIGLLLWGITAFAIVPPVQTRVMQAAGDAPALASSINIGAFNLGNALGAAVGGAVIALGLGYRSVPAAGGVLALSGLFFVFLGRPRSKPPSR